MAYRVQLAVSPLGGVPGVVQAWHSSVLVDGEEFAFSDAGVSRSRNLSSHASVASQTASGQQASIMDIGFSAQSGHALYSSLNQHFLPGTYDLLRKNCNTFSDASLFFLVQKRLDGKYRALDKLGAANVGLLQAVSGQAYSPNSRAAHFDLEKLIAELDPNRTWQTRGHVSGGSTRERSVDALRNARLQRFEHGGARSHTNENEGVSIQSMEQILADEEFARRLAEEEERQATENPSGQGRHSDDNLAQHLSDEELARSLQEAEEAQAQENRRRSSQTTGLPANGLPPNGGMPMHAAIGAGAAVVGGAAQIFNATVGGLFQEINRELNRAANSNNNGSRQSQRSQSSDSGYPHAENGPRNGVSATRNMQNDPFDRRPPPEMLEEARRLAMAATGAAQVLGGLLNSALHQNLQAARSRQEGAGTATVQGRTVTVTADDAQCGHGRSNAVPSSSGGEDSAQRQCMICFEAFSSGEQLRILPCLHKYHIACIDPWLQQSSLCPLCKHDIRG